MNDLFSRIPPRIRRWLRLRWLLAAMAGLLFLVAATAGLVLLSLPDVTPLKDRRTTLTIQVRDWQGKEHPFHLGPQNRYWTPLDSIPAEMKWAVIVAEDATFYEHAGIDVPALREALKYNLEKKRMARGASTITQQLAKNVYLSREKSLWRKLREFLLARRMERELTKGRILELYLNVLELGPNVYGVGQGARYFFDKTPGEMTPAECAFLAAILPGPRVAYNPQLKPEKVRQRAARILNLLKGRGVLDEAQYERAAAQLPVLLGLAAPPLPPPGTEEDIPGPEEAMDPDEFETTPTATSERDESSPAPATESTGPQEGTLPTER